MILYVHKKTSPLITSGYTIIEILVVITILVILFTIGQANYRSFQQRQEVESAARKFKSDLELTKQLSFSGYKPTGCDIVRYYILDSNGATKYNIRVNCANDGGSICNSSNRIYKGVDLSTDPDIQFNPANFCVQFIPLGRGIMSNNAYLPIGSDLNITIRNTVTGINFPVSISSNGVIR